MASKQRFQSRGFGMTAERRARQKAEFNEKQMEIFFWIENLLGEQLMADLQAEPDLSVPLHDGVVLCRIAALMLPSLTKFHRSPKTAMSMLENIKIFVDSCRQLGVKNLFDPPDLYEKRNMAKVVFTLHSLARVAFKMGLGASVPESEVEGKGERKASAVPTAADLFSMPASIPETPRRGDSALPDTPPTPVSVAPVTPTASSTASEQPDEAEQRRKQEEQERERKAAEAEAAESERQRLRQEEERRLREAEAQAEQARQQAAAEEAERMDREAKERAAAELQRQQDAEVEAAKQREAEAEAARQRESAAREEEERKQREAAEQPQPTQQPAEAETPAQPHATAEAEPQPAQPQPETTQPADETAAAAAAAPGAKKESSLTIDTAPGERQTSTNTANGITITLHTARGAEITEELQLKLIEQAAAQTEEKERKTVGRRREDSRVSAAEIQRIIQVAIEPEDEEDSDFAENLGIEDEELKEQVHTKAQESSIETPEQTEKEEEKKPERVHRHTVTADTINKFALKKTQTIVELIETEKDYGRDLELISSIFVQALQKMSQPIMSPQEFAEVFHSSLPFFGNFES
eukprot:TRINITY_DN2665_c1_g1_i3.p1 TRINITY_DN2665_c1_g1~~TRINITY_DN2665_c1_g1_i3.p1  ORF type:complete len:596 (+),score=180.10 TRINITY_DN2665_c1_g1_i3:41-1789(+)